MTENMTLSNEEQALLEELADLLYKVIEIKHKLRIIFSKQYPSLNVKL